MSVFVKNGLRLWVFAMMSPLPPPPPLPFPLAFPQTFLNGLVTFDEFHESAKLFECVDLPTLWMWSGNKSSYCKPWLLQQTNNVTTDKLRDIYLFVAFLGGGGGGGGGGGLEAWQIF